MSTKSIRRLSVFLFILGGSSIAISGFLNHATATVLPSGILSEPYFYLIPMSYIFFTITTVGALILSLVKE